MAVTWRPISLSGGRNNPLAGAIADVLAGAAPSNPGAGRVTFWLPGQPLRVTCKLGAESATPGGGVGGWEGLTLPGRDDAIEWGSTPGRTLSIPILIDGLEPRRSIESDIATLYTMGRPADGSPRGSTPPVVKVRGMVRGTDREWVINAIDEGAALWDGMHRVRLFATVNLMEFVPPELVVIRRRSKSGKAQSAGTYTVKRGDTLGSIARDRMGRKTAASIAAGVRELKKLNNVRDAKSIRPGQKLKIPPN